MSPKKFLFLFLFVVFICYSGFFILYTLINPNQIGNYSITTKKFFYTKEYSKKQFDLLKHKKYNLIFGTSQSHMIGTKMMKEDTLNFHNLYAEPGDILNFLKQLDTKQINNIKQIIYLIDLGAGANRLDTNLINYNSISYFKPLKLEDIKRIFLDLKYNIMKNNDFFLQPDGSTYHIEMNKSINNLYNYNKNKSAILEYNHELVKNISLINQFAKINHIKIKYITPVTNDKYFATIDLKKLYTFYEKLINNNINNLSIYYFINELSNPINGNIYLTFEEKDHLNQKAVKYWLDNYILNKNDKYLIKNKNDLIIIFNNLKMIQNSL